MTPVYLVGGSRPWASAGNCLYIFLGPTRQTLAGWADLLLDCRLAQNQMHREVVLFPFFLFDTSAGLPICNSDPLHPKNNTHIVLEFDITP